MSNFNIDKSKWTKVKFGDVVSEVRTTSKNPVKEGLERLVGLEHIDTENIHIKRWGLIKDGTTFSKKFNKGQVLFGRRRAYLKKAAVADFDGICSGDITVFEAKDGLIPNLLPFIVQNEKFFEFAMKNSAGSLSPRVKFKDLENFELLLPPKDQQSKIAELLWAADEMVEQNEALLNILKVNFISLTNSISNDETKGTSDYKKLKQVARNKDNLRRPLNSSERNKMAGEIPYYGANGLVGYIDNYIFDEELVLIAEDGGNFSEFFIKPLAYKIEGKSWVNNHVHVLVANQEFTSNDWLYYSLVHKNILKHIVGTTRVKLNKAELENLTIWCPSKEIQTYWINKIKSVEKCRNESEEFVSKSNEIKKILINKLS